MNKWVVPAIAAVLFSAAAINVFVFESTIVDEQAGGWILGIRSALLTDIAQIATNFGSAKVMIPLALVVSAWWLVRYRAIAMTVALLAALLGGIGANLLLKMVFHRPRPEIDRLAEAGGYSFPSGHAMMSTIFYGMLFYLLWRVLRRQSRHKSAWAVATFAVIWIASAGFFRIYLGVHYTTDVIAGFSAGLLGLLAAVRLFHFIRV